MFGTSWSVEPLQKKKKNKDPDSYNKNTIIPEYLQTIENWIPGYIKKINLNKTKKNILKKYVFYLSINPKLENQYIILKWYK